MISFPHFSSAGSGVVRSLNLKRTGSQSSCLLPVFRLRVNFSQLCVLSWLVLCRRPISPGLRRLGISRGSPFQLVPPPYGRRSTHLVFRGIALHVAGIPSVPIPWPSGSFFHRAFTLSKILALPSPPYRGMDDFFFCLPFSSSLSRRRLYTIRGGILKAYSKAGRKSPLHHPPGLDFWLALCFFFQVLFEGSPVGPPTRLLVPVNSS